MVFFFYFIGKVFFCKSLQTKTFPSKKSFSVFTYEVAAGSEIIAENLEPERPGKQKTLTAGKFNGSL